MKFNSLFLGMGFLVGFAVYQGGQASGSEIANSKKGVESAVSLAYFKMGDMRLINNDWGSRANGCNSSYKIFIKTDGSFGWEFNRGACGGGGSSPDFPEIEFGIHPFGKAKNMITSPDFTSTTLLPLQIKDIRSASVQVDQMTIELQSATSWNLTFELWFTDQNPITGNHTCPYAEIMTFWGWEDGRWPCDQTGNLTAGTNSYVLCHKAGGWGCGWTYYSYNVNGGPLRTYNGKLDIKALLDWLVNNDGMSKDLWVSRFEVGSEIGDNTRGKVTMKNITFEVNGVSKVPEFSPSTGTGEIAQNSASRRTNRAPVEMVNLRGEMRRSISGARAKNARGLSEHMSKGIYIMYAIDGKGMKSGKPVIFPVLY